MADSKEWESYEEVAAYLLGEFKSKFGLESVEGKQVVTGERSGTEWEIDAKGVCIGSDGFLIVECRRWTTSKQKQENIGAIAYRIIDTCADGAIIISPLGIQEGAEKVAKAENIIEIRLNADATTSDYILRFLNDIMVGVADTIELKDEVSYEIERADGTTESKEIK